MKLIFMDFEKIFTIDNLDIFDSLKDKFVNSECNKLWLQYEEFWKKGLISNSECLTNQFNLLQLDNNSLKSYISRLKVNDRGFKNFFKLVKQNNKEYKFFIISENVDFIIRHIMKKVFDEKEFAILQSNCNLTEANIIGFLNQNWKNNEKDNNKENNEKILVFSNILNFIVYKKIKCHKNNKEIPLNCQKVFYPYKKLSLKKGDTKNTICKKCIKDIIVNYISRVKKAKDIKTIFIGANYTEGDIELAKSCDKVVTFSNNTLTSQLEMNNNDYTSISNFSDLITL